VAFTLQDLGGLGGTSDVSDYNSGGSQIISALENVGVNFAAGAANVGVAALGNSLGVSPSQLAQNSAALAYNSALLTRPPGTVSPIGAALGVSPTLLVVGGLLVVGLIGYAIFRK